MLKKLKALLGGAANVWKILMGIPRNESIIFEDLTKLCGTQGYVYVIAYFSLRDNFSLPSGILPPIKGEQYKEVLVRTEISTLIGLLVKSKVNKEIPAYDDFCYMIIRTQELMKEMHDVLAAPMLSHINNQISKSTMGSFIREGVFYGPDSAYDFQYLAFLPEKYTNDNEWLLANKGFSIEDACEIIVYIEYSLRNKIYNFIDLNRVITYSELLSVFIFSVDDIAKDSNIDKILVTNFVSTFILPANNYNENFLSLGDYNTTNSCPLLVDSRENFCLIQFYSLLESLYESPFYWMIGDKKYKDIHADNHGLFTEELTRNFVRRTFDKKYVFSNVKIVNLKGVEVGEIDLLVLYGDKAIIFQVKSKRLTRASRKGNDRQIKDDFKAAIGDAYNQSLSCSNFLNDENYKLLSSHNVEIYVPALKNIFIVCVVSDHYPTLSAQARQFLNVQQSEIIASPLIIDLFYLDILTELVSSPLYLLSFLYARSTYAEKLLAVDELTVLSFHLKKNLWFEENVQIAMIDQHFVSDITESMVVRRRGVIGERTPNGILTRYLGTTIGLVIASIENCDNPIAINLGMLLLRLSEEAMVGLSNAIDTIIQLGRQQGSGDFSLPIEDFKSGITIHCNNFSQDEAEKVLVSHCLLKKYKEKADTWYGVSMDMNTSGTKFLLEFSEPWKNSNEINEVIQRLNL